MQATGVSEDASGTSQLGASDSGGVALDSAMGHQVAPADRSARFVDFAITARDRTLPADVAATARLVLIDTVGAMVGACAARYPIGGILHEYAREQGGAHMASVVGADFMTGPALAATVNATLAYALDVESLVGASITHAAAVVVPAAIAVAEAHGATGKELITAIVMGIEGADRISRAITPQAMYASGFHPSAVAGAPAAALAASLILRLDSSSTHRALGLACTQSSGLMAWERDPTEQSRPFNVGIAARNGVTAALLARLGYGGPHDAIAGRDGLLHAFGGERASWRVLDEELGTRFAIRDSHFKQFACCAFLQSGAEAVVKLAEEHRFDPADVDTIELHYPRTGAPVIDGNPLRSHCAQYVLAVALTRHEVTFDDIATDWRLRDATIRELSRCVSVRHSVELDRNFPAKYTSRVVIGLRNGDRFEATVAFPRGHPKNPMTLAELTAKFRRLAVPVIGEEAAHRLEALIDTLDSAESVRPLAKALRSTEHVAIPGVG